MYTVSFSRHAARMYDSAQAPLQRKLYRCFLQLSTDPRRHPQVKPLSGDMAGYRRYRLGDYRVVYLIDEAHQTVYIESIEHRREVYR